MEVAALPLLSETLYRSWVIWPSRTGRIGSVFTSGAVVSAAAVFLVRLGAVAVGSTGVRAGAGGGATTLGCAGVCAGGGVGAGAGCGLGAGAGCGGGVAIGHELMAVIGADCVERLPAASTASTANVWLRPQASPSIVAE